MSPSEALAGVNPHQGRPAGWSLADEAFSAFLGRLEASKPRRRALVKEKRKPYPVKHTVAQRYQEETEQLRRVIAVERARWFAEQRGTA